MNIWHFHHNNTRPHSARLTQDFLANSGLKVLKHPPYSPDLAPCDFILFPLVKEKLKKNGSLAAIKSFQQHETRHVQIYRKKSSSSKFLLINLFV
ncbi:hypothetical protein X777_01101 [Ooceraea biroi]|uniref:Histone-lysine N-methyltransferase SETMAR n=1 Tax=Ooceraea biroi TaxID=2015173 RepID=A0A026WR20_OOCBI|nr:hypothetical protein X777_01101 [Ooceraea biroi]